MHELKIVKNKLLSAIEDNSGWFSYFLNLKTGDIEIVNNSDGFFDTDEIETEDTINKDEYISICSLDSSEGYLIMVEFIEQLKDKKVKDRFSNIINRESPFRNFKAALLDYPHIREQWFDYRNNELIKIAQEWL